MVNPSPGVEVGFGVDTEGARDGVNHRHFSQGVSHDHSDKSAEQISDDDAGPGELDGDAATQEKADSDRAPDGNHCELARTQAAMEIGFGLRVSVLQPRRSCFRSGI